MALPLKYYNNNLVATLNLLESMGRHGCKRVRNAPTASARRGAFCLSAPKAAHIALRAALWLRLRANSR